MPRELDKNLIMNNSISCCITCYDGDYHFLDRMLNEYKKQTVAPDEIVISCSGMKHSDILKTKHIRIANKDVPVVITNSEERKCAGEARNQAVIASSMDVIQFLDVDDIPHINRTEFTKIIFDTTDYDALVHSYFCKDWYCLPTNNSDSFQNTRLTFDANLLSECSWEPHTIGGFLIAVNGGKMSHGAAAWKKKVFNKIQYTYESVGEDCIFCGNAFNSGFKIGFYDSELMHYIT